MQQKIEKWERWLGTIRRELRYLAMSRYVYLETADVVHRNDQIPKPNLFFWFVENAYAHTMTMGVRRQVKTDSNSISMLGLLKDIANNAQLVNRTRVGNFYNRELANRLFDELAGPGKEHVDPAVVHRDIADLQIIARTCESFADRRIAHTDKRGPDPWPKFAELDEALDKLETLFSRYAFAVLVEQPGSFLQGIEHNWKDVFRQPWLPSGPV